VGAVVVGVVEVGAVEVGVVEVVEVVVVDGALVVDPSRLVDVFVASVPSNPVEVLVDVDVLGGGGGVGIPSRSYAAWLALAGSNSAIFALIWSPVIPARKSVWT
jgi:hypothetical protein